MSSVPADRRPVAWVLPAIVLAGICFRGYHYLRCPTVWHDEAAVVVNILQLDFGQLLGPLHLYQAAPPLFLWLERTAFLAGGDSIQVLRFVPFLASCLSLLLMVPVARTLLPARAALWALFLFACSDKLLWHTCEVKPYALDVFAAVLLLRVHCAGLSRSLVWQLSVYALLAPILLILSYPASFLYGAILISLLPAVWREGRRAWLAYGLLGMLVAGTFLLLALGPVRNQKSSTLTTYWTTFFPDWSHWWTILFWIGTATLEIYRYCFAPLGQSLAVFALAGAVVLWRERGKRLMVLLVGPGLLALGASFLGSYPYGGTRLMIYLAPGLALLIAAGTVPILDWLRERGRLAVAPGVILLLWPLAQSGYIAIVPWPRPDTGTASAWVMEHRQPDDPVLGNDWTHIYYFRRLGTYFQQQREGVDRSSRRAWVVYTGAFPKRERIEQALAWMGDGWKVSEHYEFDLTTVLLLARQHPDAQARR